MKSFSAFLRESEPDVLDNLTHEILSSHGLKLDRRTHDTLGHPFGELRMYRGSYEGGPREEDIKRDLSPLWKHVYTTKDTHFFRKHDDSGSVTIRFRSNGSVNTVDHFYGKVNEAHGDNDYWRTMPYKHLHAETHRELVSLGYSKMGDQNGIKRRYEKNFWDFPGDLDGPLSKHGWYKLPLGDRYTTIYNHPNGSTIIHKGHDLELIGNWEHDR